MLDILINKINRLIEDYHQSNFKKNFSIWYADQQKKLQKIGKHLSKRGISANAISIFGFVIGMMAINFLAMDMYFEALICILINRFCDILDGIVARMEGITPFGIFLDAALDFIFYAGIIFGFALANPEDNAVAACFLLFGFTSSATAMLAYGIATSYQQKIEKKLPAAPFYLGGLSQGSETLISFVLLCLMPFAFLPVAIALGCWCLIKTLIIVSTAYYKLVVLQKSKN